METLFFTAVFISIIVLFGFYFFRTDKKSRSLVAVKENVKRALMVVSRKGREIIKPEQKNQAVIETVVSQNEL